MCPAIQGRGKFDGRGCKAFPEKGYLELVYGAQGTTIVITLWTRKRLVSCQGWTSQLLDP